jgi:hypothetical protein
MAAQVGNTLGSSFFETMMIDCCCHFDWIEKCLGDE